MHRPPSAPATDVALSREPYCGEGPLWVVARAEEELVARYGGLTENELGLTAAMFDPRPGSSWWPVTVPPGRPSAGSVCAPSTSGSAR
jgi:hypothetical protein